MKPISVWLSRLFRGALVAAGIAGVNYIGVNFSEGLTTLPVYIQAIAGAAILALVNAGRDLLTGK